MSLPTTVHLCMVAAILVFQCIALVSLARWKSWFAAGLMAAAIAGMALGNVSSLLRNYPLPPWFMERGGVFQWGGSVLMALAFLFYGARELLSFLRTRELEKRCAEAGAELERLRSGGI